MNIKIVKILPLFALFLFITGVGCSSVPEKKSSNNQEKLIEEQQKQMEELANQVQILSAQITSSSEQTEELDTTALQQKKSTPEPVAQLSVKTEPAPVQINTQSKIEQVQENVQPTSQPVVEPNFSSVAVALYQAHIDVIQNALDDNAKAKIIYADTRQMWKDELMKANAYLDTYPSNETYIKNAKLIDLLVQFSDNAIVILEQKEAPLIALKSFLQNNINTFEKDVVSHALIQKMFDEDYIINDKIKELKDGLLDHYDLFSETNHTYAVYLDTSYNTQIAKTKQDAYELDLLMTQTNQLIANTQASLNYMQNTVNSLNYSGTTYCTATNIGSGRTSIVCN